MTGIDAALDENLDRKEAPRARAPFDGQSPRNAAAVELESEIMIGPDGVRRTLEEEWRINELHKLVFRGAAAEELLAYYRSITLHRVHGPEVNRNNLLHVEGQRYLFGLMDQRRQMGIEGLPKLPDPSYEA